MLIVALIVAFVLYVALCLFYQTAQANINVNSVPFLVRLREAILSVPDFTPLFLLKWGIVMFAFYMVGDAIITTAKRRRRDNTR